MTTPNNDADRDLPPVNADALENYVRMFANIQDYLMRTTNSNDYAVGLHSELAAIMFARYAAHLRFLLRKMQREAPSTAARILIESDDIVRCVGHMERLFDFPPCLQLALFGKDSGDAKDDRVVPDGNPGPGVPAGRGAPQAGPVTTEPRTEIVTAYKGETLTVDVTRERDAPVWFVSLKAKEGGQKTHICLDATGVARLVNALRDKAARAWKLRHDEVLKAGGDNFHDSPMPPSEGEE
jgi:hypothetical protein